MKANEIFEYLKANAPGLLQNGAAAELLQKRGDAPWLRAAAEVRLDSGALAGLWSTVQADGAAQESMGIGGALSYRAADGECSFAHFAENRAARALMERFGALGLKAAELILMPNGKMTAVSERLGKHKLPGAFATLHGRAPDPISEQAVELCGGRAALTISAFEDGRAACFGLRLTPEKTRVRDVMMLLSEGGLCCESAFALINHWCEAFPSFLPRIYNRVDHIDIAQDENGALLATAALGMSEWEDAGAVAYCAPAVMNLELTTRCPLRCPQCYCELNTGKDLPLETALYWIAEAGKNRVHIMDLSGGETMCYPYIYELVAASAAVCPEVNVALSGWGFDDESYDKLIAAGVSGIFISLNGPTREINAVSRDGFELAIAALELLKRRGFPHTAVNWVMHNSNADSLGAMLELAEEYCVETLAVMAFKPDSSHALPSLPTAAQMKAAAKLIRDYKGPVNIEVEACFSQMRALVYNSFFGNRNNGIGKGCGAGRDSVSVNVDGLLSPCRHLDYFEKWDTLAEYWRGSSTLKTLRETDSSVREPCASCRFLRHCRHCMAINSKLNGAIYQGNDVCPLAKED